MKCKKCGQDMAETKTETQTKYECEDCKYYVLKIDTLIYEMDYETPL
jgi:DNA-directed RNA polymerase subunit M/transcription elongation factor TFIIS